MTEQRHESHWRLFWALPLPPQAYDAVAAIQREMARRLPVDVIRWIPPINVHLTLVFLGSWPQRNVPALVESAERAIQGMPPFRLQLSGIGAFPNPRRPRVVWLGVQGDLDALHRLQNAVARAMIDVGWRPESKPFTPHMTIGRVRKGLTNSTLAHIGTVLQRLKVEPFGAHEVDQVFLFKSDLRPSGAVYTPVIRLRLE